MYSFSSFLPIAGCSPGSMSMEQEYSHSMYPDCPLVASSFYIEIPGTKTCPSNFGRSDLPHANIVRYTTTNDLLACYYDFRQRWNHLEHVPTIVHAFYIFRESLEDGSSTRSSCIVSGCIKLVPRLSDSTRTLSAIRMLSTSGATGLRHLPWMTQGTTTGLDKKKIHIVQCKSSNPSPQT